MIISKTPFRVSLFGGGTDFPSWYNENESFVISTTINKYCYIACRYLPPFFESKYRAVYSEIELVKNLNELKHPVIREALKLLNFDNFGTEIIHYSDLPSRTGIGSSSSFTVGLVHCLLELRKQNISKTVLANLALNIEQKILNENVGSQDQIAASFGGFNYIKFYKDKINVNKIKIQSSRLEELQDSLLLFYTGISRFSSDISKLHIDNIKSNHKELVKMTELTKEAYRLLNSSYSINEIGKLLDEAWKIKNKFSNKVSNKTINHIYTVAKQNGALGGKVLGAGGGGFVLIFANKEYHPQICKKLKKFMHIPFKFSRNGSTIIKSKEQI